MHCLIQCLFIVSVSFEALEPLFQHFLAAMVYRVSDYLEQTEQVAKPNSDGDVAVVKEDFFFSTKWTLARVSEVHCGNDGLVRVVSLKTPKGVYKHPLTKLD